MCSLLQNILLHKLELLFRVRWEYNGDNNVHMFNQGGGQGCFKYERKISQLFANNWLHW